MRDKTKDIIEYYNSGRTVEETAKHFNMQYLVLRNLLCKHNIIERKKRQVETKDVVDYLNSGKTLNETADQFGMKYQTVYALAKRHGVNYVNGKLKQVSLYQILADLLNTDKLIKDIAKENNISVQRVYQIINDARSVGINVRNVRNNPDGYYYD